MVDQFGERGTTVPRVFRTILGEFTSSPNGPTAVERSQTIPTSTRMAIRPRFFRTVAPLLPHCNHPARRLQSERRFPPIPSSQVSSAVQFGDSCDSLSPSDSMAEQLPPQRMPMRSGVARNNAEYTVGRWSSSGSNSMAANGLSRKVRDSNDEANDGAGNVGGAGNGCKCGRRWSRPML